jgi:hypothetical protein
LTFDEPRDYIITFTKRKFNPITPSEEDIVIEDVAHALSLLSRAGGHSKTFYSVAQHCINCAKEAKARGCSERVQLACLLHDASEAYIGDVTRPFKKHLKYYLEVEEKLQSAIWHILGVTELTDQEQSKVYEIDDALLYCEFIELMDEVICEKASTLYSKPDFEERGHNEVEREFLALYNALFAKVNA